MVRIAESQAVDSVFIALYQSGEYLWIAFQTGSDEFLIAQRFFTSLGMLEGSELYQIAISAERKPCPSSQVPQIGELGHDNAVYKLHIS